MFLHLGCGKRKIPGFVNVDIQKYDSVDVVGDITQGLPFEENSVDLIYSCAVIEHFNRNSWKNVLKYWYSLLKPGGILQVSTLDFNAICNRYLKNNSIDEIIGILLGGSKDFTDRHGVVYDFEYLKSGLEEVGFIDIKIVDWRDFEPYKQDKNYDDFSRAYLPHMNFSGDLMMLNIQASK
jgi:predicted SAM-dependent methyltransferase